MKPTSGHPSPLSHAELVAALGAGEALVAGVLSGTSADGIDVALMRPRFQGGRLVELGQVAFETVEYGPGLRARLRRLLDDPGARVGLGQLARLDRDLGLAFGRAVRAVAGEARVDLVGSHGQTLWHHDGGRDDCDGEALGATLQLGDGDFLAEAAGAAVVSDLRRRDLAVGGEGAPLTALLDPWLLAAAGTGGAADGERLGLLNLGGYGNLTLMVGGDVRGNLDTGPAGALLDGLARRLLGRERDEDGAVALGGSEDLELLASWEREPGHGGGASLAEFVATAPPRSTGRDTYGEPWVARLIERAGGHLGEHLGEASAGPSARRSEADLFATGCGLVAHCVAASLELPELAPHRPDELLLAGGGVHNPALVAALARHLPDIRVASSATRGLDPDAREALCFGLFAAVHLLELPLGLGVTGAKRPALLGKLSPAPQKLLP
ncbi:MAG: anhydro-N-acetylmuramic acid kinase [Planctomycetota bacterium]|nr:anhydro-N-acetylmuramic acid kinase [Planctomycetota bacterium]